MTTINEIKQKHNNIENATCHNIENMMNEWLQLNPRPLYEDSYKNAVNLAMWMIRKEEACTMFTDETWQINTTAYQSNIEQSIINREKSKSMHHAAVEYVENLLWNLE